MSLRSARRRMRQATASHDWLEGASVVLGVFFFLGALAAAWALAVSVAALGEPEPELASTAGILQGSTDGALESTRWFGIALFGVVAILAAAVGWFLAGDAVRRTARRILGR